MDGASPDTVAIPGRFRTIAKESDESIDLPLHKRQLIDAARSIDPLKPLRRHPVLTVAAAAVLGVVAASPAAARSVRAATRPTVLRQLSRVISSNIGQLIILGRTAAEVMKHRSAGTNDSTSTADGGQSVDGPSGTPAKSVGG